MGTFLKPHGSYTAVDLLILMGLFAMPKRSFYEVEKLIGKRKSSINRVEYLVRWKGYAQKNDTWEPLSNLHACMDMVQAFNADKKPSSSLRSSNRESAGKKPRPQTSGCRPKRVLRKPQITIHPIGRAVERENSREKRGGDRHVAATRKPELRDRSTLLPKKTRLLRSLRQRRGRSSSPAPRPHHTTRPSDVQVKLTPMSVRALGNFITRRNQVFQKLNGLHTRPPSSDHEYCNSLFLEFSPVWRERASSSGSDVERNDVIIDATNSAVPRNSSKRIMLTLKQPTVKLEALENLDRKLRLRETLSKNKYIYSLRRGQCTEVVLTNVAGKNAVTPEILDEMTLLLDSIATDPTSVVLLTSVGDFFCTGLELNRLVEELKSDNDSSEVAKRYAVSIRNFVNCLIDFPKPVVALVQGPATGLGCAMLPHFDTVYCSERAYFALPYTSMGQTPEACSSFLFPKILGHSLANDMLLNGTTLTAQEAKSAGLVSGVYVHDSLVNNVLPLLKHLATKSQEALMTTKELIRNPHRSHLKHVNQCEYIALRERWQDPDTIKYIQKYLRHMEEI